MMKCLITLFSFFLLASISICQVNYEGPATGSVSSGIVISTNSFKFNSLENSNKFNLFNHFKPDESRDKNSSPGIYTDIKQKYFSFDKQTDKSLRNNTPIVLQNFNGIGETNSIPPDPYITVGEEHIISIVNSRFRISSKDGTTKKTISINDWYEDLLSGVSAFDPKITYDQFDDRWVMVWLHVNTNDSEAYFLISVSDDSNPIGDWYSWKIPSTLNGSTPAGNWGDYEGVGYDDQAIYITSNQFSFSGSYAYNKIRIIPKQQLYGGPGKIQWSDLWDISYPDSDSDIFGIRPARMKDTMNTYYLAVHSSFITKKDFGVYKLKSPLSNPSLEGQRVSVEQYDNPSDPEQLGGGEPQIDGGRANLRNEPIFINGKLYLVHSVRNGTESAVRLLVINENYGLEKDVKIGETDFYHTYPAVAANKNGDILITYSRSSADTYMGAYFTVLQNETGEPVGNMELEEGHGNYVVTYSGDRNRWGDYNGAWLDPTDQETFWIATEFVAGQNDWGVKIGEIKAEPLENPTITVENNELQFDLSEVNVDKDTNSVMLTNLGHPDLMINSINSSNEDFSVSNNISYPYTLSTLDTLELSIEFKPTEEGAFVDSLTLNTNDPTNPEKHISLAGTGYIVHAPAKGKLYGTTGKSFNADGLFLDINSEDAGATEIGKTGFSPLSSLVWNKEKDELAALSTTVFIPSNLIRISAIEGIGYHSMELLIDLYAMAFNNNNELIGATDNNKLYKIEYETGDTTFMTEIPIDVNSMAFHPGTNVLYANSEVGDYNDLIYRIDTKNGDTTRVGRTGLEKAVEALDFDNTGQLYGTIGKNSSSKLFKVNITDGSSDVIGDTEITGVLGIKFVYDSLAVNVKGSRNSVPRKFALKQNYPNPFNPTTTISYSIPTQTNVKLTIYDILGKEIEVLVDEQKAAGRYDIQFDGGSLTSGVYIYKLETDEFSKAMKMQLLK